MKLSLIEHVTENLSNPTIRAFLEISQLRGRFLDVYSSSLVLRTKFQGLEYYMYDRWVKLTIFTLNKIIFCR